MLVVQLVQARKDGKHTHTYILLQNLRHDDFSSVTLVGEADRKMLKAAIKRSSGEDQVRHRIVPADTIQTWVDKLASMKEEIAEILVEEKEEKHVRIT